MKTSSCSRPDEWHVSICSLKSTFLRSETYQYYTLPFCTPKEGKEYKPEGLGEVLEGDRLVNTPYSIKFRVDKENEDLCSRELTAKELKKLRIAVKKDYYFQVLRSSSPCRDPLR